MAKISKDDAEQFTRALQELCARHGVMLWTAVKTVPINLSPADTDELKHVHYTVEQPDGLQIFLIRRVLSREVD